MQWLVFCAHCLASCFTWQKFSPINLATMSVKTLAEKNSDGLLLGVTTKARRLKVSVDASLTVA